VALAAIFGRVVHLQLGLGPWYRVTMAEFDVRTRAIRAPRGCIRAGDGTVLAIDRCDADLSVHYRYLERPLDEAWLERQARARLSRRDRRDAARVAQAVEELRHDILTMWQSLSQLTGVPVGELDRRAGNIQSRVERIAQSVNRRRRERWEQERGETPPARADSAAEVSRFREPDPPARFQPMPRLRQFCAWLADEAPRPSPGMPPEPVSVVEQDRFSTLVTDISPTVLLTFASHPERFPGVRLDQRIRRVYPCGALACGVVGYIEPSDDADEIASGPAISSGQGLTGVEGSYEPLLCGVPGHVREKLGLRGGAPQVLGGRAPQPGHDITLTLDLRLQRFAEESLTRALEWAGDPAQDSRRASSGAIVALDVQTGAILVAASAPQFDLNIASQPTSDDAQELISRGDAPLFNRIVQMTLAPGSTFKPVTAIAALKSGIDPRETYYCRGFLHRPHRFRCLVYRNFAIGHESVMMHDALVRSCNVYFFQVAERLGPGPIVEWAQKFGFGHKTGIDLAGEQPGSLASIWPAPNVRAQSEAVIKLGPAQSRRTPSNGEVLGVAIGQGSLEATPLQVAVMMAAIANGGLRVVPHVRRDAFQPPRPIDGLAFAHDPALDEVRKALDRVVADPRGTGHEFVYLPEVEIAGKTGTAQSGSPQGDHAWFAGYAPAKNPRVAVAVALEHAGSGAHAAGPLARDLIRCMYDLNYFPKNER
jgi:penicillin-binding protein 2